MSHRVFTRSAAAALALGISATTAGVASAAPLATAGADQKECAKSSFLGMDFTWLTGWFSSWFGEGCVARPNPKPTPKPNPKPTKPIPTNPAPTDPAPSPGMEAKRKELFAALNDERRKAGKKELVLEDCLNDTVAQPWAVKIAGNNKLEQQDPKTVLKQCNAYKATMGGSAQGFTTAKDLVTEFSKNPQFREHITGAQYDKMGVGVAKAKDGTLFWVFQLGDLK